MRGGEGRSLLTKSMQADHDVKGRKAGCDKRGVGFLLFEKNENRIDLIISLVREGKC